MVAPGLHQTNHEHKAKVQMHRNRKPFKKTSLLTQTRPDSYPHPDLLPKQVRAGPTQQVNKATNVISPACVEGKPTIR